MGTKLTINEKFEDQKNVFAIINIFSYPYICYLMDGSTFWLISEKKTKKHACLCMWKGIFKASMLKNENLSCNKLKNNREIALNYNYNHSLQLLFFSSLK